VLRVGLTGGLGSGKSTAAQMFAANGAQVFSADEIGREMMQPGEAVYAAIVEKFGPGVVRADGSLDRVALARIAFGVSGSAGRIEELNAIVHPAVIARQAELIAELELRDPDAVAIVESALIFQTKHGETKYGGERGWHRRFDTVILVTAPEELRIARFVERAAGGRDLSDEARAALETEARRRIANQVETERNAAQCQYVLNNDGSLEGLRAQVDKIWPLLRDVAKRR
jgi:dephospho-CoA kinase